MKIENIGLDQYFKLTYKYSFEGYVTYEIEGKCRFFYGKGTICFKQELLNKFQAGIEKISVGESISMQDNDSDSYVKVMKRDSLGHYDLFSQIGGTHQNNYCKIEINTDHSGILKLIVRYPYYWTQLV